MSGGRTFSQISAGNFVSCALDDTHNAFCWGYNGQGQLGIGTDDDSATVPTAVAGGRTYNDISTGFSSGFDSSTCAVTTDDSAYCWGLNNRGQLGIGTIGSADDSIPRLVTGGLTFAEVSVGGEFACGLAADDTAYCWGRNLEGQLGSGSFADDSVGVPTLVSGGISWKATPTNRTDRFIDAGTDHVCAVSTDDSVYCWGSNEHGKLGIGSSDDSVATPTRVSIPGDPPVRGVSAGYNSTCAITDDTTYCWGLEAAGQLGNGTNSGSAYESVPVAVIVTPLAGSDSTVQISSGENWNTFIVKLRMLFDDTALPTVQVGQTTSTTVTVTNNRPWAVTLTDDTVSGGAAWVPGGTCSAMPTLNVDDTCTVNVSWTPSTAGALSASLTLNYEGEAGVPASYNSSTTALTGTATSPPAPPLPSTPPTPPRDVRAEAGDASATVTWAAPADPGSFPVTSYAVTSSPAGGTCVSATTQCEVQGLTNGTTYTFTVKALNGVGWSAASAPSNAVTPRAAAAPTITITGSRSTDGARIEIHGTTTGLVGSDVRPWTRFPGETSYAQGSAIVTVDNKGRFTWSRKANKKTYVYFRHNRVKSNTVVIAAR